MLVFQKALQEIQCGSRSDSELFRKLTPHPPVRCLWPCLPVGLLQAGSQSEPFKMGQLRSLCAHKSANDVSLSVKVKSRVLAKTSVATQSLIPPHLSLSLRFLSAPIPPPCISKTSSLPILLAFCRECSSPGFNVIYSFTSFRSGHKSPY